MKAVEIDGQLLLVGLYMAHRVEWGIGWWQMQLKFGISDRDNPHLLLEQVDKYHDLTW